MWPTEREPCWPKENCSSSMAILCILGQISSRLGFIFTLVLSVLSWMLWRYPENLPCLICHGKQRSRFHVGCLIEINDHREQGQCCNKQNVIYLAAVSDLFSLGPPGSPLSLALSLALSLSLPCWNKQPLTSLENQLKPYCWFPVMNMLFRVGKQGPTFIQKQFRK